MAEIAAMAAMAAIAAIAAMATMAAMTALAAIAAMAAMGEMAAMAAVSNHFTENSSMRSKMKAVKFTTNELIKSDLKNRTFLSDKNRSRTKNFLVHPSQLLGSNHE